MYFWVVCVFSCLWQWINVQTIIPKCGSPKGRETVILPSMAMTARSVLRTATSVGLWPHSEAQRHKCADVNYAIRIASTLKLINRSSELHLMQKPNGNREAQRHIQKPNGKCTGQCGTIRSQVQLWHCNNCAKWHHDRTSVFYSFILLDCEQIQPSAQSPKQQIPISIFQKPTNCHHTRINNRHPLSTWMASHGSAGRKS